MTPTPWVVVRIERLIVEDARCRLRDRITDAAALADPELDEHHRRARIDLPTLRRHAERDLRIYHEALWRSAVALVRALVGCEVSS